MSFTEEWFSPESQQALAELYSKVAHLPGDVIEVGCWEGRSTVALANACHPEHVQAIDTWAGSPGEISADLAQGRDVYATFAGNIETLTAGNVTPHRMGWRQYLADTRGPVKFIHIDAEHTYTEVRDTIEAVRPLMVPGGVICGDDNHHPPIQDAVRDTLGNAWLCASLWHWTVPGGAP